MKLRTAIAVVLGVTGILAAMLIHMSCGKEPATRGADSNRAGKTAGASSIQHYNIPRQDGNNPYSGGYSHRDLWVIEHAVAEADLSKPIPEGSLMGFGIVDAEGYLIPELEKLKQHELASSQGVTEQLGELNKTRQVIAIGERYESCQAEFEAYQDACLKIRAKYYPRIPKWLADNPPSSGFILPDGRVVTVGLLGGTAKLVDSSRQVQSPPGYGLYSSQGQLIKSVEDYNWYLLFMPMNQLARILEAGKSLGWNGACIESYRMGFIGLCNDAGELVALYDYDGTPLTPPNVVNHKRDQHNFTPLTAKQIKEMYAAQQ
jgi:hypothetical protein